jgi:hypothetical protein
MVQSRRLEMASLFENSQWAVTDWGLESVKPGAPYKYNIEASRLLEKAGAGGGALYDWPIQMAEKNWIDMRAFREAFMKALELHKGKYQTDVDGALLEQSFKEAAKRG